MEGTCQTSDDDFVLETVGHCFFCLAHIPSSSPPAAITVEVKVEEDELPGIVTSTSPPTYSLQSLSRYLKMNLGKKVARATVVVPKKKDDGLKVELCEGCGSLTQNFSSLFQQLEQIQLEVKASLGDIHSKMVEAEVEHKTETLRSSFEGRNGVEELLERLNIVEELRREALIKCSLKLKTAPSTAPQPSEVVVETPAISVSKKATKPFRFSKRQRKTYPWSSIPQTTQSGRYKCNLCDHRFGVLSSFYYHYNNIHLQKRYRCELCAKEFCHMTHLRTHQKSIHMGVTFKCQHCGYDFTRRATLRAHQQKGCQAAKEWKPIMPEKPSMSVVLQPQSYSLILVPVSSQDTEVEGRATTTMEAEGDPLLAVTTTTDETETSYLTLPGVKTEIAELPPDPLESEPDVPVPPPPPPVPTESDLQQAQPPPKSSSSSVSIPRRKKHEKQARPFRIHPVSGLHICGVCSKEFTSYGSFFSHHKAIHCEDKYVCPDCGREFNRRDHYTRHHNSVHLKIRFECPACGTSFGDKYSLKIHQTRTTDCGGADPNNK